MKEVKEKRRAKQFNNASPEERVRLARNRLASQIFNVNNYNSLTSFQKKHVDREVTNREV